MIKNDSGERRQRLALAAAVLAMAAGVAGSVALVGATGADAATATVSTARASATQRVVVRPVTAKGRAMPGWKVTTQSRSVQCTAPSAGAVDNGIAFCGTSADYTVACWRAATKTRVLCLPDPTKRRLESIKLTGRFPSVRAPKHPSPQSLRLKVGSYYEVRDGGTGPMLRQHPTWVAFYFGDDGRFIAGPRTSDGINRRHAEWFVTSFRTPNQQGLRQGVATAYFVGTAR